MRQMYRARTTRIGLALVSLLAFLALWQAVVWVGGYPAFILPPPLAVVRRLGELVANGTLWFHA